MHSLNVGKVSSLGLLWTYSFSNILLFTVERVRLRLKSGNNLMSLENYVSRSELWANGKMTNCSFDTPIFNIKMVRCTSSNKKDVINSKS